MDSRHDSADEFSKQLTDSGQPSCHDVENLSFSFHREDSASVNTPAKVDTDRNTINLSLANYRVVLVGQSHVEQASRNLCCNEDGLQCDSSLKDDECSERQKDKFGNRIQAFDELQGGEPLTSFVDDIEPPLPVIKTTGYLSGERCEEIIKRLGDLQDNGRFEKHDRMVTYLKEHFARKGNTDMQLAMIIERGVAFSYQKKSLKKSKRLFSQAIKIGSNYSYKLHNRNVLLARAFYRFVQVCRYKNNTKLQPLLRCLEEAEYLLQNHDSPEDFAEIYYNYGSVYLAYMSKIPDDERNAKARKDHQRTVREYFEKTIEAGKRDPRERVRVKQQIYGHLRVATVLLDCTSTVARTRIKVIPPQDIADAVKHLDILQYQLADDIPRGTQVQILKTRSDQYYRQGEAMYPLAKETAKKALRLAQCHEFSTELSSLQERIDFLDQLCRDFPHKERIQPPFVSDSEASGYDGSGEASASETEQKCSI